MSLPVLILGFNSDEKLSSRFLELQSEGFSDIYVALDGAPDYDVNPIEVSKCLKVQDHARQMAELGLIQGLLIQERNLGQGIAIPDAISWFFTKVELGLILEDDCELVTNSGKFLSHLIDSDIEMNELVICLSNIMPVISRSSRVTEIGLIPGIFFISWGWVCDAAKWREYLEYQIVLNQIPSTLERIRGLNSFQKRALSKNWGQQAERILSGTQNTWALKFTLYLLEFGYIVVTPSHNLIRHIGSIDSVHMKSVPSWYRKSLSGTYTPLPLAYDLNLSESVSARYLRYVASNLYGAGLMHSLKGLVYRILNFKFYNS